jgi:hypothetical protein
MKIGVNLVIEVIWFGENYPNGASEPARFYFDNSKSNSFIESTCKTMFASWLEWSQIFLLFSCKTLLLLLSAWNNANKCIFPIY